VHTPWEDHLLERKTDRDLKDIKRTAVAFANSVTPGHTARILIGESNDGRTTGIENPDEQQRKVRSELEKIYPPIVWRQRLYEKEGKTCIEIEIEHSSNTPHFGDAAWVRKGSETIKATEEVFQWLIDTRSSKVRELGKWLGRDVIVSWSAGQHAVAGPNWTRIECRLVGISTFFATFKRKADNRERSEPISWLELSWDDNQKQLRIFVNPEMSKK
jgi:hypothetical protein